MGEIAGMWGAVGQWEFEILDFLQSLHSPQMDRVMVFFTSLAEHGRLWILLGLLFLCCSKTRRMGMALLFSVGIGYVTGNFMMKPLFARNRPCWIRRDIQLLVRVPMDYSFPSGHTLVSFEGASSIWRHHRFWGVAAFVVAAVIGYSRMYLYVHFPTDILAGAVLGVINGWAGEWMAGKVMGKLGMAEAEL